MKWRPQILTAVVLLSAIAFYGLAVDAVEVATGCTGGIIALGMKLLENNEGG